MSTHIYRIVLRASILVYTQQFQWCLVHLAVFVTVNSRASCLLTPPISVIVNSDNTSSTTHHSLCLNGINSCSYSFPHATTQLFVFLYTVNHVYTTCCSTCIVVCIPVRVGLLNVPCYDFLRTVLSTLCVHHIHRAGSSLTTTSGVTPAHPKCLALH